MIAGATDPLLQNRELHTALNRAWPLIEATDLVGDLWSVPAYLRLCAPWLSRDDAAKLQRGDAQAWTVSDLPLLDAARQRLGDPEASRRKRRHDATVATERERMASVVDDLIEAADDEYGVGLGFTESWPERLEFGLVVLIDPEAFGKGIEGAVDRYVAMTRATQQLVILTSS